jgi:hypothetical protein
MKDIISKMKNVGGAIASVFRPSENRADPPKKNGTCLPDFPPGIVENARYRLQELSKLTRIPLSTLYSWTKNELLTVVGHYPIVIKADVLLLNCLNLRGSPGYPRKRINRPRWFSRTSREIVDRERNLRKN